MGRKKRNTFLRLGTLSIHFGELYVNEMIFELES